MGWSGGSNILGVVVDNVSLLPETPRRNLYVALVKALENDQADTLGECEGYDPILDSVLLERGHIFREG